MKTSLKPNWRLGTIACALTLWIGGCGGNTRQGTQSEAPQRESWGRATGTQAGGRYDLAQDERRGGHTLKKHVGRSDEELRQRLDREQDISAASTWTDRDAAEATVGEALRKERGRIESWEGRGYPRANLALHYDAGYVIGRSMKHGDSQSSPCQQAVIVLKADGPDSFYVLTAYPEARQ
ncbi:MAG: hypothetical protein PVS2B2_05210 [Candidatus Acidiferrum sp.]